MNAFTVGYRPPKNEDGPTTGRSLEKSYAAVASGLLDPDSLDF